MNYVDTINRIRSLARGEECCNDELCHFLLDRDCYYLLSKSKRFANRALIPTTLNSYAAQTRYQTCANFFKKMNNIPYASIKGALLSARIYGNTSFRTSGDIDFLVPLKYSDEVKSLLHSEGFIQGRINGGEIVPYNRSECVFQKSFTHQLAPFVKMINNKLCPYIAIDINFDITWGESQITLDIHEFVKHIEKVELFGIPVNRLAPVYEFISLCLHHYKDINSIYLIADRGISLSEYCDIYFYLINIRPDIDDLVSVTKQYCIGKYVFYCIYYTHEIFKDERLLVYLDKLVSEDAHKLIDCYGLSDLERKEWNIPFYERLLDKNFKAKFYSTLTSAEKRKIQINRRFM